ncbi:aspartyl protease family protein At5g10770-like [Durio zibethinus]|uniref:Aspartyl protease family protein At5g10770-like n=1 Tax=Durio zibethinus TaxID=66656 RepID=A0A6P5ZHL4_DURZI|nr:aspartyl protease family protein At5g10770-like [Durio zibethinus]
MLSGNSPGCPSSACVYDIQYGDSSFYVGVFAKEKLTLTSTVVFDNFLFGCGQNNQGLFGGVADLLGLGLDNLSLPTQTALKYKKFFSYCLASSACSTASIVTTAGAIIDSGTVITRMPPTAYAALRSAFRQRMNQYQYSHETYQYSISGVHISSKLAKLVNKFNFQIYLVFLLRTIRYILLHISRFTLVINRLSPTQMLAAGNTTIFSLIACHHPPAQAAIS